MVDKDKIKFAYIEKIESFELFSLNNLNSPLFKGIDYIECTLKYLNMLY